MQTNFVSVSWMFSVCLFSMATVQSGQRPAAAVRGSAPPGSPRRVAPLRLQQEQQESLQREKEEAQQKERARQAEEREKEEQTEEVSCRGHQHLRVEFARPYSLLLYSLFYFILCHSGSEAAGTMWTAGEAAESSERRTEEDFLGSRSLHHHHSALLPQGSQLEWHSLWNWFKLLFTYAIITVLSCSKAPV